MKLIDKDALAAKIRKRLLPVIRDKHYDEFEEGRDSERLAILDIINNFEVKDIDLEKEIDDWYNNIAPEEFTNIYYDNIEQCARHFFELGLNAKNNKR